MWWTAPVAGSGPATGAAVLVPPVADHEVGAERPVRRLGDVVLSEQGGRTLTGEHHPDPALTTDDKSNLLMIASGLGIASPGEDAGTEQDALECAQIAIEFGFDVNAVNDGNETALHGAAYRGAPSIVQLLVDRGAKTFELKNQAGWTPLRIAASPTTTLPSS